MAKRRDIYDRYSKKLFHDTGNSTKLLNLRNSLPRGGFHL